MTANTTTTTLSRSLREKNAVTKQAPTFLQRNDRIRGTATMVLPSMQSNDALDINPAKTYPDNAE